MAKSARDKIKLESTAGTGHFYTTTNLQVRSGCSQARDLQGNEAQVIPA